MRSSKELCGSPCNLRASQSVERAIFEPAYREDRSTVNPQRHRAPVSKPTLIAAAPMRDLARLTWFLEKPALLAASKMWVVDR